MSKPTRPWRAARRRSPIRLRSARRPHAVDPAARMRAASAWPLDECLVSADWRQTGAVTVVWVRRHPDQPRYATAVFHADLTGGGLDRAIGHSDVGRAAVWSTIEGAGRRLERCDPTLAVKLLYTALDRAPDHRADPDWLWVSELLGATDPDRCAVPVPELSREALPTELPEHSLGEHLRRTGLAMFSPVPAADA